MNFNRVYKGVLFIAMIIILFIPKTLYASQNTSITPISMRFNEGFLGIGYDIEFEYSDDMLLDHCGENKLLYDLAKASICLANAAYDHSMIKNVEQQMGYGTPLELSDEYYEKSFTYDDCDHVAYTIVRKKVENKLIYLVVIRGTYDPKEWYSDFHLGVGQDHKDFYSAANEVITNVVHQMENEDSVGTYSREDRILWVTGHSRGAAVGNIVAGIFSTELSNYVSQENVFGYNFACPRVTKRDTGDLKNIYNFNNPYDLIPMAPFEEWGYHAYGVDITLPQDNNYTNLRLKYKATTNQDYAETPIRELKNAIFQFVPTSKEASDPLDQAIIDLVVACFMDGNNFNEDIIPITNRFFENSLISLGISVEESIELLKNNKYLELFSKISSEAEDYLSWITFTKLLKTAVSINVKTGEQISESLQDLLSEESELHIKVKCAQIETEHMREGFENWEEKWNVWKENNKELITEIENYIGDKIIKPEDLDKAEDILSTELSWSNTTAINLILAIEEGFDGIGQAHTTVAYEKWINSMYYGFEGWKNSSIKEVDLIKAGSTIGIGCFENCSGLNEIIIPNNVRLVCDRAFAGTSLTKLSIADGVRKVGNGSFISCSSLKTVICDGTGELSIGDQAFSNCTSLENVPRMESIIHYGQHAFSGTAIKELHITDKIEIISYGAFYNCTSLTSVTIDSSETKVESFAFDSCTGLTDLTIPVDLEYSIIVNQAGRGCSFYDCKNIHNIHFTPGKTGMMRYYYRCTPVKFSSSNLQTVIFDEGIKSIADGAFSGCRSVTYIVLPSTLEIIGKYSFGDCVELRNINIPEGVVDIGEKAFFDCYRLKSITIPNSVKFIGAYAFCRCCDLDNITIPDNVTNIYDFAFSECLSMTNAIVGNGVKNIGNYAFSDCENLKSVLLSKNVESIGEYAFSHCNSLISIIIPDSVKSMGEYAFYECTSLTGVTIGNGLTSIERYSFYECNSLKNIDIGDNVTDIGDFAFYFCNSLQNANIPGSVKSIGWCAFNGCRSLLNVTIPDTVTEVGNQAFCGCTSLTNVVIGNNVTCINEGSFCQCYNLKSVEIGDNVTKIGKEAFYYCKNLNSILIPDTVTVIDENAFGYCNGLTDIVIPDNVTILGKKAFKNCDKLKSATIGKNISYISEYSFYECINLSRIIIPMSVLRVGKYAFSGCVNLQDVYYYGTVSNWLDISVENNNNPLTLATKHWAPFTPTLLLPAGLNVINSEAFVNISEDVVVYIPKTVTGIADDAFDNNIIIIVSEDSYAEHWAKNNNFFYLKE